MSTVHGYVYFESSYSVLAAALSEVWAEFSDARTPTAEMDVTEPPASVTRDTVAIWRHHHALITAVVEAKSSDDELARLWDELTALAVLDAVGPGVDVHGLTAQERDEGEAGLAGEVDGQ